MNKPCQLKEIDLTELRASVQYYIDRIADEDYDGGRDDHYQNEILETAIQAVFGKDVYDWINQRDEEQGL